MPVTKQGEALAAHIENKEWEKARILVQRIVNVQTLLKSGWEDVWNVPDVPSTLVYSLLVKIKVLSISFQNKLYPIGLYPWMFQEKFRELWREASVSTCKAFLQALTHTYRGGITVKWPKKESLKDEIYYMWSTYLGLPSHYSGHGGRVEAKEESRDAVMSVHSLDDLERVPELQKLWEKTELLIKASVGRDLDSDDEDWLVLHAIAKVDCLSVVMWFALKLYPEQIRTRDANGNLPLHIAVQKPIYAQQYFVGIHESRYHHFRTVYPEEYQDAEEFMACFLLNAFPEGATYMDAQHHVPLVVSLLTLAAQREENSRNQYYIHSDQQQQHRLNRLIEAAPEALVSRDFETRLYPFQTAASVNAPLDSIYTLLRSDPSALKYRRLTKREADYERLLKENSELKSELNEKDAMLKELRVKLKRYEGCGDADYGDENRKRARTSSR